MPQYIIDTDVAPVLDSRNKYPFNQMAIGDSLALPLEDQAAIRVCIAQCGKRHNKRFISRMLKDHIRVWRVPLDFVAPKTNPFKKYEIERAVPIVAKGSHLSRAVKTMEVGEFFDYAGAVITVQQSVYSMGKKLGRKFTTRTVGRDLVRIWRTA